MQTISTWPKTKEQMIEEYKIDTDFRDASKMTTNTRQSQQKQKNIDGTTEPIIVDLRQTDIERKPKYWTMTAEWSVDVLKAMLDWKDFETRKAKEIKEKWNLWWLVLSDLHLNARDINNNSFNKRAKIVNDRINRVLDRLMRFDPEKLLIPNLWDMSNSDIKHFTSSLKVPMQDNISMEEWYKKLLEREIALLENLKQYGLPLKYVKVWGNHDSFSSQTSAIALQYYFKNSDIQIDVAKNRYYEIRGNTMIALSHGDRWEGKKLFQMVVDECISKTRKKLDYMYAILGHHHRTIVHQEWPLEITNVQAPADKSEFCDKYWLDMKQSMSWFVWSDTWGKIAEVRG